MKNINIKTIVFVIILILMGFIIFKSATNPNKAKENAGYILLEESLIKNLLIGKWQSIEDPKFSREFRVDGFLIDNYEGYTETPLEGTWRYVKDVSTLEIDLPDIGEMPIVEILFAGKKYYFGVIASLESPDSLSLVYLDGNMVLNFSRIVE